MKESTQRDSNTSQRERIAKMLDTTAMTGLRVEVRPFPHRDSHNRTFFIVRHNFNGIPEYLHRRNGEVFWAPSTQYADEYHCEWSGYFATEQVARNTLAAMLRKERAQRRVRIPELPQQVNPLQKAA